MMVRPREQLAREHRREQQLALGMHARGGVNARARGERTVESSSPDTASRASRSRSMGSSVSSPRSTCVCMQCTRHAHEDAHVHTCMGYTLDGLLGEQPAQHLQGMIGRGEAKGWW